MFTVKRILVPIDYTDVSRMALSAAIQFADLHDAHMVVLHVQEGLSKELHKRLVTAPNESVIEKGIAADERALMEAIELEFQRAETAGFHFESRGVTAHISGGDWFEVAMQIIEDEKIDLVFSGTHGPKGIKGMLLGSVTEKLVAKAPCSVFVVKPQGYPYLRD